MSFKTYKEYNEGYDYVNDPFRQGKQIFSKNVKIGTDVIMKIEGYIDGKDNAHTAIISVLSIPIDNFGEDGGKERFIVHQKNFDDIDKATEYIKEMETKISFK